MPTVEITPPSHPAIVIPVGTALLAAFRREAARRDTTTAQLIYDLLEIIATDNLTAAVLD